MLTLRFHGDFVQLGIGCKKKLLDNDFSVGHVFKEGNIIADVISTFQEYDTYIWWHDIPESILRIAAKDRYKEYLELLKWL